MVLGEIFMRLWVEFSCLVEKFMTSVKNMLSLYNNTPLWVGQRAGGMAGCGCSERSYPRKERHPQEVFEPHCKKILLD